MSPPTGSLRLAVSGASGRMGLELARLAGERSDIELVGGIGRETYDTRQATALGYEVIQGIEQADWLIRDVDVVIDFSRPAHLARLARRYENEIPALVVGTTGIDAEGEAALEALSRRAPVLVAANFSLGVALVVALARRAAAALPDYDVEITEVHHRRKEDAPSGTALRIGEAVAEGRGVELDSVRRDGRSGETGARPDGEVAFHSLRGGDVVGEHRLHLLGERERIEIGHAAGDRSLFADGALRAARWLRGRKAGRYGMDHLLDD